MASRSPIKPPPRAPRRPTARDVASAAGVSQSAVSRCFTPGASISVEVRRKVSEAAARLGYRPNGVARSLITRRSGAIGIALGYMDNQFYPALLGSMSARFGEAGYRALLFTPGLSGDADPILNEVLRHQVEAVVLMSVRLTSHFAQECAGVGVPVVLVNRTTAAPSASSITGDNRRGGAEIARFLLAGGHRRLAFLAGLEDASTSRDRERGFTETLRAAGLDAPLRDVGQYDFDAARAATRRLLGGRERPDAVFCANDHMAFALIETARSEFGVEIGCHLSVIGFDDVPLASWPSFDLTTYAQPIDEIATRVVAVTRRRIAAGAGEEDATEIVPGRLVVRGSARRPVGGS